MELAAKAGSSTAELDFIGRIEDETGAAAGAVRDKITIKLKSETAQSAHKIQYDSGFTLAPGRYALKLLARENVSGKMGTFESRFTIPDLSADSSELKLSTVVFSNQREPVKSSLGANPLVVSSEKFIPNITKVFQRDRTMYVNFDVYDALPDPSNPQARNVKVSLSLLDEKGTRAFETGPVDATQLAATRPEAVPVNLEIPLKGIAPGPLHLRARRGG